MLSNDPTTVIKFWLKYYKTLIGAEKSKTSSKPKRRHLLNNRKSEDIDVEMTPVKGLKLLKNNVLMPLNAKIGLR